MSIISHNKKELSNEEEISKLYNFCRCFVYPGEVGLSIIHAMSYGLPAIIHNNINHHNPEHAAFTNEVNGLVFDENNPTLAFELYLLNQSIQNIY